MALDSRQKRAAVIGVGRMWYRNPHPSGMNAAQRASVGQVYPVAVFQAPVIPTGPEDEFRGFIANVNRMMG